MLVLINNYTYKLYGLTKNQITSIIQFDEQQTLIYKKLNIEMRYLMSAANKQSFAIATGTPPSEKLLLRCCPL